MGLSFVPIGIGDAFSSLYYSSAVVLEADGHRLLVDCPHPLFKILREASARSGVPLDAGGLLGVALTHLHADHSAGLEGFAYHARFVQGRRPKLILHPDVLARLWDDQLAAGMDELRDLETGRPVRMRLEDYFEVVTLDHARPVQVGPFRITCRRTQHHVPTYAMRITAAGRTLGVSSDTPYDPDLVAWLAESDLVLHETGHGIHASYQALAVLPAELRRRMRLIHLPDGFEPDGAIEPLVEGRRYEV